MKSGLLLLASLFVFSAPGSAASLPETIVVYPDRIICNNYIGVGVQWSAYPHGDSDDSEWGLLMTDEKWEMLYDRLDRMKPRFIRVIDQANWRYFKGLDRDGKPILSFENQQTRALFRILDYCQRHAITVLIGEWGVPGVMHDPNDPSVRLMSTSDMRWIGMIGEWMAYLINEKGYTCIRYYDFVNEPNGDWACTDGNFAEWPWGSNCSTKSSNCAALRTGSPFPVLERCPRCRMAVTGINMSATTGRCMPRRSCGRSSARITPMRISTTT